ncbi:MAG TPA: hypothetical protein VFC63_19760 [Blastocatellia bacterium]|nr:hypothetical protein [Blastocatellia bacterium]
MKRILSVSFLLVFAVFYLCPVTSIGATKGLLLQFKGVALGDTKDVVHQKMGKPKSDSDGTEEYDLGESNSMEIQYGPKQTVETIVLYFYSNDDKVPKFEDVIGDSSIDKRDNGSQIGKAVDSKSKASVTMVQTGGASPMTVITIKQL